MNPYQTTPEIPDNHPIVIALQKGDDEMVKRHLDEGVSPYTPGLIAGAIGSGKPSIVQAFLDHGLDLSLPFTMHGETPIFRSISTRQRNMAILEFLLENGASVGYDPAGSSTPLLTAAESWPEAIPVLLGAGADVHAVTKEGRTPLMGAAHRNQLESMELLLAAGANLEDKDKRGTTPLISAAKAGKAEAIKWLLDHGANIQATDNAGKNAEYWARENGHLQIAEMLQSRIVS
jgi:uncharacterized protein